MERCLCIEHLFGLFSNNVLIQFHRHQLTQQKPIIQVDCLTFQQEVNRLQIEKEVTKSLKQKASLLRPKISASIFSIFPLKRHLKVLICRSCLFFNVKIKISLIQLSLSKIIVRHLFVGYRVLIIQTSSPRKTSWKNRHN